MWESGLNRTGALPSLLRVRLDRRKREDFCRDFAASLRETQPETRQRGNSKHPRFEFHGVKTPFLSSDFCRINRRKLDRRLASRVSVVTNNVSADVLEISWDAFFSNISILKFSMTIFKPS